MPDEYTHGWTGGCCEASEKSRGTKEDALANGRAGGLTGNKGRGGCKERVSGTM